MARPDVSTVRSLALVAVLLAALPPAGCALTRVVEATAVPIAAEALAFTRVAGGATPSGPWSYAAKVAVDGSWCDQLKTTDMVGQGCSVVGPAADEVALDLNVGDGFVAVTGAIGADVAEVRLTFGDGSVGSAPIFGGPGGRRFIAAVLRAAPVPDSWQALGKGGNVLSNGSFQ